MSGERRLLRPLVYVAGPITSPSPMVNTHRGLRVASVLLDSGVCVPMVPHLSTFWDIVKPRDYETWMRYDLDMIEHCHALVRLDGVSAGADREVVHAQSIGLPVFPVVNTMSAAALDGIGRCLSWCERWISERAL